MKRIEAALKKEELELMSGLGEEVIHSMGELILSDVEIPKNIYILTKGQIRQVSRWEEKGRSLTVGLFSDEYIFIAGLSSLNARCGTEVITAATDCNLRKISQHDWQAFCAQHPEISRLSEDWITPADLWPVLNLHKQLHTPSNAKEIRVWLNRLTDLASCYWIEASERSSDVLDTRKQWFLAQEGQIGIRYGEIITDEIRAKLSTSNDSRIRLIGLPRSLLVSEEASNGITTISRDIDASSNNEKVEREYDNLESRKESGEAASNKETYAYRFFDSSKGAIPEAIASFKTVSHLLRLPLKVDLLQRILEEQATRGNGEISLDHCAVIAESMGLQTQLLKLPLDLITRLRTPCFIHFLDGELCVGLDTREGEILIARPTLGLSPLSIDELLPLCNEDRTISVLTLEKTDRTPEKKFSLAWFLPAIKKHKKQLIEVLIASLFVQIFQLMNPLVVQQIIDKVIGRNGINTLPVLAVLLFSFSIFENVLTAVRTNLFIETTNRIDISLGEQVIDHLLRLPMNYFDKRPVGELSSRVGELEQIRSFLTGTALTVVMDSIFSIIYIIVMLFYSWILTIVALLVAPLLGLLTFSTSPVIRKQLRSKAELNAKTQNHLVEVLTGIQTVKAQNFELKARWRWKERYSDYVSEGFKNAITATARNGLTKFLNQASTLSILCVGAYLVINGQLTLGQLIAFRIISGYVTGPLLRLSNLYQNFQQAAISIERLADIIDTPQESTETDRKNIPLPTINGNIVYENVSFRFGKDGPLQLSQVNLSINEGEFVAIVGQSGSGKSTLTKLLPRLYEPLAGRILVDQTDVSKVELYSLRRQIGIVPQDSLLFEGSVQDNISLSNPEATSEDVVAAARIACAHEFIMGLPSGYASSVGERGGGLSGGQRQRIAIARTILQNPRLLIMDEATSALDYQTERLVSLNLMEHFRGRTVLFITHRLNSVIHADRIVLMHQGQVEEQGSHEELMQLRGRYYALYQQQESIH